MIFIVIFKVFLKSCLIATEPARLVAPVQIAPTQPVKVYKGNCKVNAAFFTETYLTNQELHVILVIYARASGRNHS